MEAQRKRGDVAIAERLRNARLATGHSSGRAAAVAAGWSLNTYKAHEGGQRALTEADVTRYAAAFKVDPGWLATGSGPGPAAPQPLPLTNNSPYEELDDPDMLAAALRRTEAHFAAKRLTISRRLAGFATASEACRYFSFVRPTYGGHEYGDEPLPRPWASIYATAFGVEEGWLLAGADPSGVPPEVFEAVLRSEANASWLKASDGAAFRSWNSAEVEPVLAQWIDPRRRGATAAVADLRRRLRLARLNDAVAGEDLLIIEASGNVKDRHCGRERWGVPHAFLEHCGLSDRENVVVVACDMDLDPVARTGDRLVLDLGQPDDPDGVAVAVDRTGDVRLLGPVSADGTGTSGDVVKSRLLAVFRRFR